MAAALSHAICGFIARRQAGKTGVIMRLLRTGAVALQNRRGADRPRSRACFGSDCCGISLAGSDGPQPLCLEKRAGEVPTLGDLKLKNDSNLKIDIITIECIRIFLVVIT